MSVLRMQNMKHIVKKAYIYDNKVDDLLRNTDYNKNMISIIIQWGF